MAVKRFFITPSLFLLAFLAALTFSPRVIVSPSDNGGAQPKQSTISGTLEINYDRESRINTYTINNVEDRGTKTSTTLPSSTSFSPTTPVAQATYTCNLYGPSSTSITSAYCTKTSTPKGTPTDDELNGKEKTTTPSTSTTPATTTPPKDDQPLSALLPKSSSKTPSIIKTSGCTGATYTTGILKGVSCEGATKDLASVIAIIRNIITMILLPVAGAVFVLMFVAGGIMYITSAGNDQMITRAKKTLTAAVVGLIIVVLALVLIKIFATAIGGGVTNA